MELPEDLASLKRPVLQKLCKKAGLKANGKNVDMIRALEDLRISGTAERSEQGSKTEEEVVNPVDPLVPPPNAEVMQTAEKNATPLISPPSATPVEPDPVSSPPPPPQCSSPNDQPQKKQPPRKKRAKRRRAGSNSKKRSKSSSRDSTPNVNTSESPAVGATSITPPDQENMEIETPKSDIAMTPVPPHVALIPEEAVAEAEGEEHSTPPPLMMSVSRKRSRRDTFSVSPKPSKQARLDTERETLSPMMEPAAITAERPPFSPPSSTDRPSSTNRVRNATYTKEPLITEEDPPPFSPPSSTDRPSSSRKRVRNATYTKPSPTISSADSTTVEPPSSSPAAAAVKPGEVVDDTEEKSSCGGSVDTPPLEDGAPPSKRQRRSTFDLSTDADVAPTTSAGIASEPESGQSSESVMSEMLSLLEKRVEQRKADPSYKPVPSSTAHSRIPVKSAVVSRLDRAHKKQFSKMRSIVDHQRRKERQIAETSSSRTPGGGLHSRPTLSSSAKRTVSTVTKAPGSSKGPAIVKPVQQRRPLNPGAPKTTPFQPTVLKTQNARFNFNKTQAEQKAAKMTETAGFKTPGKQQSINTASKSGKKFKPYTGKVTSYGHSIY